MDYKAMLKLVQMQNKELSFKDAQKLASSKLRELNAKLKETGSSSFSPATEIKRKEIVEKDGKIVKEVSISELVEAEKRIRTQVVDINRLVEMGRQTIPGGEIVKHGKSGVNTLVTFEDKIGNKLPVTGYFVIYM